MFDSLGFKYAFVMYLGQIFSFSFFLNNLDHYILPALYLCLKLFTNFFVAKMSSY